jgi:hypothetical protein
METMVMRTWSRIRLANNTALVAVLLAASTGCYEYRAVETAPVGERVALQISDRGRVGLAERFGPGLAEIRGQLVSQESNEYVLNVLRVSQISGNSSPWSGEVTRVDRSFVGLVRQRQLSPAKTTLVAAAAATVAYLIASGKIVGNYSQEPDTPGTGDPPLSNRIPLRIPLGFRF